jgi:diguanylate cyclase (GGDEF)-like protein
MVHRRCEDIDVNRKGITQQLFFLPAVLSIWLILSSALLTWLDPQNILVFLIFIIFSCTLCLNYRLRWIGWILAVVGSALYFSIRISSGSVDGDNIRLISIGVTSILGSAVLSTITAEQINTITTQIRYSRKMIEEMRLMDPLSGLLRFHYARKNLSTEVARCHRYGKNVCLMIARIANWNDIVEHRGLDVSQQIMAQVGYQFSKSIRNTDIAAINIEKICVILPETRIDDAIRVAQRIVENCSSKAKVGMNIGIACFPHDAADDSDLIRNAESALQISMTSGQHIIIYSQIKSELEQEVSREGNKPYTIRPSHPETKAPELLNYRRVVENSPDVHSTIPPWSIEVENKAAFRQKGNQNAEHHSNLTENQVSPQKKTSKLKTGESGFDAKNKTNWVKPYHPPVSNLKLESKVDGKSSGYVAPDNIKQIAVGITGISDMDELTKIEKAIRNLPFVCGLSIVDFQEGVLIINISHTSENFIEMMYQQTTMTFDDIRGGSDWLEISLRKSM